MSPTIEDLRATLTAMAQEHPAPAPHDLLDQLRAERKARAVRRRWGVGTGVAAAVAAAVALAQPWDAFSDQAQPAHAPGSPTARGWILSDGAPPPQADGLVLLEHDKVSYDGQGQIRLGQNGQDAGVQRYAVLWCDRVPQDPAITPAVLQLSTPAGATQVPCTDAENPTEPVVPVPLPDQPRLAAQATWTGDVPRRGAAVLGVYREATWQEYDVTPVRPGTYSPPAAGEDAVIINPASAHGPVPGATAPHPDTRTVTATITEQSTLLLWRGVPSGLEVTIDGVRVTDDGESTGGAIWQHADAELRRGAWTAFTGGQQRSLDLPAAVRPAPGQTRTVTISVTPRLGDTDWQVALTHTAGQGVSSSLAPTTEGGQMPQWYAGHRRAGTWHVPADGLPVDLRLPEDLRAGEVVWAVTCPGPDTSRPLPTASVSVDGTPTQMVCRGTEVALGNLVMGHRLTQVNPDTSVQVSLPALEQDEPGTVTAYVAVPFAEFDHQAAHRDDADNLEDAVFPGGPTVEHTITVADLDQDGRVRIPLTDQSRAVRFTTEGVGRIQLLLDGQPATAPGLTDGWWTAWTGDPFTETSLVNLQQPPAGDTLEVHVEGYETGGFKIDILAEANS